MEKMFSNYDYVKWLMSFIREHERFLDDDWIYTPEEISKEDFDRVQGLQIFYDGIDKYADSMNIEAEVDDDGVGCYFRIRFGNDGFKIGVMHGQGVHIYCSRDLNFDISSSDCIDMRDVISFWKADPNLGNLKCKDCNSYDIFDDVNESIEEMLNDKVLKMEKNDKKNRG